MDLTRLASGTALAAAVAVSVWSGQLFSRESEPGIVHASAAAQSTGKQKIEEPKPTATATLRPTATSTPKPESRVQSVANDEPPTSNGLAAPKPEELPNITAVRLELKDDDDELVAGRPVELCVVWSVEGRDEDQRFEVAFSFTSADGLDRESQSGSDAHRVRPAENERDCFTVRLPAGDHSVYGVVDSLGVVEESNEGDNIVFQVFTWAEAPIPDLVPEWANVVDNVYCPELRISLSVLNFGTGRAGESQAQLLVNGIQPSGGKRRVGRLDPDERDVVVFGAIDVEPGAEYDFIVRVDADNEVDEYDESNAIEFRLATLLDLLAQLGFDPGCSQDNIQDDDDDDDDD